MADSMAVEHGQALAAYGDGMSHCEWRPIEEAPKFGGSVCVWHDEELIEASWTRRHKGDSLRWCRVDHDRYGDEVWPIEPQPKYYLAVTPPPED